MIESFREVLLYSKKTFLIAKTDPLKGLSFRFLEMEEQWMFQVLLAVEICTVTFSKLNFHSQTPLSGGSLYMFSVKKFLVILVDKNKKVQIAHNSTQEKTI